MITREILEAQKQLYETGLGQAVSDIEATNLALESLKASAAAFGGGIEAMNTLLGIVEQFEEAERTSQESPFLNMVITDKER